MAVAGDRCRCPRLGDDKRHRRERRGSADDKHHRPLTTSASTGIRPAVSAWWRNTSRGRDPPETTVAGCGCAPDRMLELSRGQSGAGPRPAGQAPAMAPQWM